MKPLLSRLDAFFLSPLLKAIQEILFKANFAGLLKRLLKPNKKGSDNKLNWKDLLGSQCQITLFPLSLGKAENRPLQGCQPLGQPRQNLTINESDSLLHQIGNTSELAQKDSWT